MGFSGAALGGEEASRAVCSDTEADQGEDVSPNFGMGVGNVDVDIGDVEKESDADSEEDSTDDDADAEGRL